MSQNKTTKRALVVSVLALVLCCAMLIGTTFAWFTDTVAAGNNKIVAGNLDIEVQYKDANGEWQDLKEDTDVFANILWEPEVMHEMSFKVMNVGNLALQYSFNLAVTGNNTTTVDGKTYDLTDVIKMAALPADANTREAVKNLTFGDLDSTEILGVLKDNVNNNNELDEQALLTYAQTLDNVKYTATADLKTEEEFNVVLYWEQSEFDNLYNLNNDRQGDDALYITFGVNLYATQVPYEKDMFDANYDEGAEFAQKATLADKEALAKFVNYMGSNPGMFELTLDDDMEGVEGIVAHNGQNLTVDFGENNMTVATGVGSNGTETNGMQLLKGADVTLTNGTLKADGNVKILVQNYANLKLENMTLEGTDYALSSNNGNVVVTGGTNITATVAVDVMHWHNRYEGTTVTFDKDFTGIVTGALKVYCYEGNAEQPVTDNGAALVIMGNGAQFNNTGINNLEDFQKLVADGYVATGSNGNYTVNPVA